MPKPATLFTCPHCSFLTSVSTKDGQIRDIKSLFPTKSLVSTTDSETKPPAVPGSPPPPIKPPGTPKIKSPDQRHVPSFFSEAITIEGTDLKTVSHEGVTYYISGDHFFTDRQIQQVFGHVGARESLPIFEDSGKKLKLSEYTTWDKYKKSRLTRLGSQPLERRNRYNETKKKNLEVLESYLGRSDLDPSIATEIKYLLKFNPDGFAEFIQKMSQSSEGIEESIQDFEWLCRNDLEFVRSQLKFYKSLKDELITASKKSFNSQLSELPNLSRTKLDSLARTVQSLDTKIQELNEIKAASFILGPSEYEGYNHLQVYINNRLNGVDFLHPIPQFIVELVDKMIKTNPDKKTYEELYNEITSIVSKVEQSVKERFSAYNDFTLEQLIIEHVDMPKSDVMPTATSLRSKITAKLGRKLTSSVEDIIYQYSFMLESFSNDHATEVFNYGINKLKKAYLEMMLKEHRGLTSEEIIKELSFLKEVSGESIKEKIYNAFNEFVAEQSHEGELHQINVELTRYDYHERQLKKLKDPEVEVHKSKKHGFELVDFINEPRVLVLFSKPQDADHILELVRNLRRLTAQKIKAHRDLKSFFRNDEPLYELVIGKLTEAEILGLADGTISPEKFSGLFSAEEYEKIVNLNLEHKIKIEFAPHKESYESFIRKHINVANFNAKHDIDTLDGLLRTYVKERLKVHAGSGKVKAYGLQDFLWTHSDQLASIQIHSLKAIEKQLKKDKSALDKFKKRVYSVAEAYVKASGKLGKARSAVMSFAAIFIGAVIGAPGIGLLPKYFDTKARIAVYDADASTGTESIAYHAGQEQAYAEQQQASLQLIESLSAERDFLLNGDGEVDRSISWLREQAAVKLDAAKDLDPLEDTNHDEVVSPEEDLAGNGNGEADDFYISKINGDVAQAIDLVELYNGGFGAELSYHEMFTNPQCHYHVSKPTLTADVTGVGNVGDPNPFYTESGTWSEEALDGIEEYQNHYEAEDLRAEAEAFNDEADDLQEDVDEITDQITAQQILLNGEEFTDTDGNGVWNEGEPFVDSDGNGTYTPGIVDLQASSSALKTFYTNLRSAAIDTLHDYSTGLIILGIIEGVIVTYLGGRKLYNYLKRRGQGPIGHPTFEDLCYLTKTVPGEEEFVKIEY